MGLKLTSSKHYPAVVQLEAQGMRGSFEAWVERLDDTQLAGIVDGMRDLAERGANTLELFEYRRATLEKHVDRIEGIVAEDGSKLDAKGEARDFVLTNPAAALETFEALLSTQTSAAGKNLKPSRQR